MVIVTVCEEKIIHKQAAKMTNNSPPINMTNNWLIYCSLSTELILSVNNNNPTNWMTVSKLNTNAVKIIIVQNRITNNRRFPYFVDKTTSFIRCSPSKLNNFVLTNKIIPQMLTNPKLTSKKKIAQLCVVPLRHLQSTSLTPK